MPRPRRIVEPVDALAEAGPVTLAPAAPEITAAPQRAPTRQKLADAIAIVKTLEAEIADAQAALNAADEERYRTVLPALALAEEALERAKPRHDGSEFKPRESWSFSSLEEAEAYRARLKEPPPSIEDARAALARATDARDSSLTVSQHHQFRIDEAKRALSWRRSSIDEAVREVVHFDPATAALAAEVKRLVTATAAARTAFNAAIGVSMMQPSHVFYGTTDPTDPAADFDGWAVLHRWRAALDALRTDPDAPLPMP